MKTSVCPAKEIKRTKKAGEKESEERKCPKMEIVCHMKMIQQHASIKLNKFNGELKKMRTGHTGRFKLKASISME